MTDKNIQFVLDEPTYNRFEEWTTANFGKRGLRKALRFLVEETLGGRLSLSEDQPRDKDERELVRQLLDAWRNAAQTGRREDVQTLVRTIEVVALSPQAKS